MSGFLLAWSTIVGCAMGTVSTLVVGLVLWKVDPFNNDDKLVRIAGIAALCLTACCLVTVGGGCAWVCRGGCQPTDRDDRYGSPRIQTAMGPLMALSFLLGLCTVFILATSITAIVAATQQNDVDDNLSEIDGIICNSSSGVMCYSRQKDDGD